MCTYTLPYQYQTRMWHGIHLFCSFAYAVDTSINGGFVHRYGEGKTISVFSTSNNVKSNSESEGDREREDIINTLNELMALHLFINR